MKKILILFLLIILSSMSVLGATYDYEINPENKNLWTTTGVGYMGGYNISYTLNSSYDYCYINTVSEATGGSANNISIYNGTSGAKLFSKAISGDEATINFNLTTGNKYLIVTNSTSGTYQMGYNNNNLSYPYNYNGSGIIVNSCVYSAGGGTWVVCPGAHYGIEKFNVTCVTTLLAQPIWNSPTPDDATSNNTQVTLNASCPGNVTIFFGNSTNRTAVNTAQGFANYNTSVVNEGVYYYQAQCQNGTDYSLNTTARTWTYDVTFPSITITGGNEFNNANESLKNQYDNTLAINVSFADNIDLYAFVVNVTKSGTVFFNYTNTTMNGTSGAYYNVIDTSTWNSGVYDIKIIVSDSHTATLIPNYETDTEKKSKLQFKTQTGNNIKIESRDSSDVGTLKTFDRYSFSFSFTDGLTTDRLFDVKTDKCPLEYIQDSDYKAHFISYCWDTNDGNWIDFEGASGTPMVSKIDDYHYTVYFSNLPPTITFNSIGGLNIYEADFTWYKGNLTYNNNTGIISETANLYLNMTNASALITEINASLTYNGTVQIVQATYSPGFVYFNSTVNLPSQQALYNFTWNITVNQNGTNYTILLNSSQNVVAFELINCSAENATHTYSIRLSYYDENTPTNTLSNSLDAYLVYSPNMDFSNSKNHSVRLTSNVNHSFCITPNDTLVWVDSWFSYNASNGFNNRYYLRNMTVNGTMQTWRLYNVNDANLVGNITTSTNTVTNISTSISYASRYSTLKLTTRVLSTYTYYKNVITSLQRYYVNEGTWRTVQMDESGEYGQINFKILEKDVEYRLVFLERNTANILKTTQPMKFVCTSAVCDLTYLLNPETATNSNSNITYAWNLDNITSIFNFNWSQTSGIDETIRFYVWKTTITGISSICDTSQTGQAGTLSCNASQYTGTVFVGIYENGELINGEWTTLPETNLSDFLPSGEGGFFAVMIMTICVMFGLFSPVGSIITGIIGLIIIFMLGIFSPLTMGGIIVAMIVGTVIGIKVRA